MTTRVASITPSRTGKPLFSKPQKQAVMDNLQLEIAERARKLRAQSALHAQGLRSRLEMRVNRVPQSLKSSTIADLMKRHATSSSITKPPAPNAPSNATEAAVRPKAVAKIAQSPAKPHGQGTKRSSNEMSSDDKENAQVELNVPKKRVKAGPAPAPAARGTRTASRKVVPSQVLSPRSNNSRSKPTANPTISTTTSKSQEAPSARPPSPVKPAAAIPAAKKPKVPARTTSKQAQSTTVAAGATATAVRAKRAAPKKTIATTSQAPTSSATTGGRTLRARR